MSNKNSVCPEAGFCLRGNADGLFDIDFDFERALPGQTELDKLRLILERLTDRAE